MHSMHYGDGYGDGVWSIDLCRRGKIVLFLGILGVAHARQHSSPTLLMTEQTDRGVCTE